METVLFLSPSSVSSTYNWQENWPRIISSPALFSKANLWEKRSDFNGSIMAPKRRRKSSLVFTQSTSITLYCLHDSWGMIPWFHDSRSLRMNSGENCRDFCHNDMHPSTCLNFNLTYWCLCLFNVIKLLMNRHCVLSCNVTFIYN